MGSPDAVSVSAFDARPFDAHPSDDGSDGGDPSLLALQLGPPGRFVLATGEPLQLQVTAHDAQGGTTDATGAASFEVRNDRAGTVDHGVFVAGMAGSEGTTVVARYRGRVSNPILISTAEPFATEGFENAPAVSISGSGFTAASGVTAAAALTGRRGLAMELDGRAGDRVHIQIPLSQAVAMTNAERALVGYRLSGTAGIALALGSLNGPERKPWVASPEVPLATGEHRHLALALNGAGGDASWDARVLTVELAFTTTGRATLLLDDIRLLRQFLVGANLAWLDGAYQHDFGRSFHHPDWAVTYAPAHAEAILRFCQEHGVRLLRVWAFEGCEGLVKDEHEIVTGLDATLLANFDDFVFAQLPKYDVKVMLMLTAAEHLQECPSPSPIPAGAARTALLEKAIRPFVERYGSSPWVWGVDLMNEPEAAVGGPTGNWMAGADWDTMRGFLTEGAALIRAIQPRLYVSAGSGWHESQNLQAGRFSGLGFTHLDYHSYTDTGDTPDYPSLFRHARILLGEVGQQLMRADNGQQAATLRSYLESAAGQGYWGVLAWAIDRPGSNDRLSLLAPDSTYDNLKARPAAQALLDFIRLRSDIGP